MSKKDNIVKVMAWSNIPAIALLGFGYIGVGIGFLLGTAGYYTYKGLIKYNQSIKEELG